MAAYDYLTRRGVIVPDTADILDEVRAEWRDVFGQDLNVSADTPQGVMITAEVAARSGVARNNAELANQINPNLAGGVFLDALCGLFFLERRAATRGEIPGVVLSGVAGTIIPQGSRARDTLGNLWASVGNVQLGSAGSATVTFRAEEPGPHMVAPGELVDIVDNVLGWEQISNPAAAIPGEDEQSDDSLRRLRNRTLARQGISSVPAQISALYDVPGAHSLTYRENIANTTQTIDGVVMPPHSVFACVYGGTNTDIAFALLDNKTVGAQWVGSVTTNVVEPASGQTYAVKFSRPTVRPILARVTVRQGNSVTDPAMVIPGAVVDYANGVMPGEPGFVVGGAISPFEIAGAINHYYPEIFVVKVEIAEAGASPVFAVAEIPISIQQVGSITEGSVQVIVQ